MGQMSHPPRFFATSTGWNNSPSKSRDWQTDWRRLTDRMQVLILRRPTIAAVVLQGLSTLLTRLLGEN